MSAVIPHRLATVLLAVALVTFSSSRLPAQSNSSSSSTLAIVGARVVDGSGNEPFDGTVVVRDGRIAEVGRSVRPPDGARIIEAQGKTVMPGLIDIRVHLPADVAPAPAPAPAPAATRKATGGVKADAKTSAPASASATPVDEALVRALAAYLYSGVTTIGVTDIDERKLDLLRDRLSAMKLRAPRLVAASAPANAMFGSTMNGGASASGLAMAEWKQRNATFAPEVTAALASARPAALENVRGAQKAGVRLAIASNAGQGELPHGESTLKEIRALVEAGLTPLQALTAATSGSAWALGLQSDRGFLAVGQRADLIILTGEPGAASGEVAQVAQVFVGGEEVDRAVMHTLMTKPEPVPAPAPAPTAAPTAETTTAAAKPSAEASSASTASTTTAAAKALARGGKRGRKGANATKDANAAAPTEASSSNGKATE
jgi:imidazolonepropionase-like amidohydrolase